MVCFVPLNKFILIEANEVIELSKQASYNHLQTLSGLRWTRLVTRDIFVDCSSIIGDGSFYDAIKPKVSLDF